MNLFTDLPLSPVLQQNLSQHGYINPTPVQSQAIPAALTGAGPPLKNRAISMAIPS